MKNNKHILNELVRINKPLLSLAVIMAAKTLPKEKSVWTAFISSFKKLFIGLTPGLLILNMMYLTLLFLLMYIEKN